MIKFFLKRYWLFLLIIVLISYGQLLLMFPWQDDHTLFFKLANIEGKAGYFGYGPFGQGAYKYIVTPHILIYKIFGLNPVAYFAFGILFYFLSSLVVYKVFSKVIGDRPGKVAGFLYAAGYVASDGYIRVFNSVSTSIGIIIVSALVLSYWKFIKNKNNIWYLLSILFYFLALEFAIIRTHYLISIPILFEVIFLTFRKPIKSIVTSLLRISPFIFVFYKYFLESADSRSSQIGAFFQALLRGEFYKTYSFFSGLTNIILPDNFITFLSSTVSSNLLYIITGGIFIWTIASVFGKEKRKFFIPIIFTIISIVWAIASREVFRNTALSMGDKEFFVVYFAGELILLSFGIFLALKKEAKALFALLFLWLVANLASYSIYNPNLSFVQYHRYLAHSFLALVGIMGMLSNKNKIALGLVLLWGVANVGNAMAYQGEILKTRSEPVISFYKQLKQFVPNAGKGDVFYFEVADEARGYFEDAFSVASMPEETAIAWQYGIDRYDIRRVTSFDDFAKLIKIGKFTDINNNNQNIRNIYTFFYSKGGLINTSDKLLPILKGHNKVIEISAEAKVEGEEVIIELSEPLTSSAPFNLSFSVLAEPQKLNEINYPYVSNKELAGNSVSKSDILRKSAFEYQSQKYLLSNSAKVTTSSFWKSDLAGNLIDGRYDTSWRADRILWSKEGAFVTLDYGRQLSINRLVWVNGNATNTPTKYEIEVSLDGYSWKSVASVSARQRVEPGVLQIVDFNTINMRFLRMKLKETLSTDSGSIAEIWVVPSSFSDLSIKEVEEFLKFPLGFVPDRNSFESTLSSLGYFGKVRISWLSDKSDSWQTSTVSVINTKYDGILRTYNIVLPATGTQIQKLKFSQEQIKGKLDFSKRLFVRNLNLGEITYEE